MSKKKYVLIFVSFAAALMVMLLLPFILFRVKDYSVINRAKFKEIEAVGDDFFTTESLDTAESMALLFQDSADGDDNVVVIDNTGAYSDAQSARIFRNICEEAVNMQNVGAFPRLDMSAFKPDKFCVSTYIDMSDTRHYVKVAYVTAFNGSSLFEATMNLETNRIYYYSLCHPVITQKTDVEDLLQNFINYLGMEGKIRYAPQSADNESETDTKAGYAMPTESTWFITFDNNINLICFHFDETLSILLYSNDKDANMMSN